MKGVKDAVKNPQAAGEYVVQVSLDNLDEAPSGSFNFGELDCEAAAEFLGVDWYDLSEETRSEIMTAAENRWNQIVRQGNG